MKLIDLKSKEIKKRFDANSVAFRWHNKNKSGGNFGINIHDVNGQDYQITGEYNTDGILRGLRFGFIYQAGIPVNVDSIEQLFEFMGNVISGAVTK